MSQNEMVRLHLEKYGSLSQAEARQIYNVNRLSARVLDLRAKGLAIKSEIRTDPVGRRYARYFLEAA